MDTSTLPRVHLNAYIDADVRRELGAATPTQAPEWLPEPVLCRPAFRPYLDDEPEWYREQVLLQERQEELQELRERQEREALRATWVDDEVHAVLIEIAALSASRPLARAQVLGRPNVAARRRRPACRGKPRKSADPPHDVARLGGRR
jgi:hypothetical protein